ncbi:hypothetical protein GOA59_20705 [Sinorhizobium meliloti]|nr:hypothetical protein [Sinorhizobium meliloti]MDW9486208.1 hypothetical protein [Sinorhizobium meliloti]MDW9605099.1 hypothetical protein [Sinorhizobium meliloti]MDW9675198.1 hypothetical protein [Sinorhizobium meliloti]MDW9951849.1 hypothetical protein [Sinorhizobium meliloti]MDX0386812.1 hypothetical protein [Sinorhizobium meliloti]
MRVEILGQERRRRWGDEKKLDVVMSVGLMKLGVPDILARYVIEIFHE